MSLLEYTLLAGASLFVIIDPIATVPAFLAMTPRDSAPERARMARLACLVAAGVLIAFALGGQNLFKLLGITLPAFKIAGSIVLLLIALDMLHARRSAVQETSEETDAAASKEDIAITPLAIPMLAGPGAISTAILLHAQARGFAQQVALLVCIVAVCFVTYFILRLAAYGVAWLSPMAMKIITRIMGLLLAAVAIQFILDAIAEQKGRLF
ncbi:MAG: NAAT family transporter [Chloroflexi bacterium]|nr:NAAT family transporter [Chloroflexota bacterium]